MQTRILGKTWFEVSIITFGGIVVDGVEASEASCIVAESVNQGVNYFDVGPAYGNAQYILGPAL
jgi:aryl-alcohol dehydrogenase-like predicted oxidoreductase